MFYIFILGVKNFKKKMMLIVNGSCILFYNVVKFKNCSPIGSHNHFENLDRSIKLKNWDQPWYHLPLICPPNKYSEALLCAQRWRANRKPALCALALTVSHRPVSPIGAKTFSRAGCPRGLLGRIGLSPKEETKLSCLESAPVPACCWGKRNEGKRKPPCSENLKQSQVTAVRVPGEG